jgi:hypothetical protein
VDGLAGRQTLQRGDADIDHETAARFQMRGDGAKARHVRLLRREVHDRVAQEVGERERSF